MAVHVLIGTMLAGQTRTTARRYQFVCAALWPLQIAIQNLFKENISVVIPVKSGLMLLIWLQQWNMACKNCNPETPKVCF